MHKLFLDDTKIYLPGLAPGGPGDHDGGDCVLVDPCDMSAGGRGMGFAISDGGLAPPGPGGDCHGG